jgi:hypothetical protein
MPCFNFQPDAVEIEFEVYCECGEGLCNQTTVDDRRGLRITIEPCEACLEKAADAAREEAEVETAQAQEASERAAATRTP